MQNAMECRCDGAYAGSREEAGAGQCVRCHRLVCGDAAGAAMGRRDPDREVFMKTHRCRRSINWNPFWTKAGRWRTGTREFLWKLRGSAWKNRCSPQILPKSWKSYWIVCRVTKFGLRNALGSASSGWMKSSHRKLCQRPRRAMTETNTRIISTEALMRFEKFSFGSIRIDGTTYEHDLVIYRGQIRKRKTKPSKTLLDALGHTPFSIEEKIPWKRRS